MIVQTVPFAPLFLLGGFFLLAPGLVVTLFTNSEPAGVVVVMLTAIGALVRPQASWILFVVLCALRTVPFIFAALVAVTLRVGLTSSGGWVVLTMSLVLGGIAQLRIRSLRRSGHIDI
jgi:hypothetical protein